MTKIERMRKVRWHEKRIQALKDEYYGIEEMPNCWGDPANMMRSRLFFIRRHQNDIKRLLCKSKDSASMTS